MNETFRFWNDCLQSIQSIHTQKFIKVVVHVINVDQWNQTTY